MYLNLMEQGYKLNEIDEMDIIYYLELLNYKTKRKPVEPTGYIDQVIF